MHNILGSFSVSTFLQNYWQQKPLLIRKAFPVRSIHFEAEDFLHLAKKRENARYVESLSPYPRMKVTHGTFKKGSQKNPWTVLLNDLQQDVPALWPLLWHLDFLPRWRQDDFMMSYAVDGGGVGAHLDEYDVFLLQWRGKRQWSIEREARPHYPEGQEPFYPRLPLKILRDACPEKSWILEEGDMLYLPPRVVHHGISLGTGMTLSLGFRAPSTQEMLLHFTQRLFTQLTTSQRYRDPLPFPLQASYSPLSIADSSLQNLGKELLHLMAKEQSLIPEWFGELVTTPYRPSIPPENKKISWERTLKGLQKEWQKSWVLLPHPRQRSTFYFSPQKNSKSFFFCEGETQILPPQEIPLLKKIFKNKGHWTHKEKVLFLSAIPLSSFLQQLLKRSYFVLFHPQTLEERSL